MKMSSKKKVRFPAWMKGTSREELLGSSQEALRNSAHDLRSVLDRALSPQEKSYLLHADRGDVPSVKSLLEQYADQPDIFDLDCVDPLNRSALIAAIENENIDLIKLLLNAGIQVKDALLHAIKEEYVEAVELLLQWEEDNHVPGEPYSWESVDPSAATFTPDITPLILAAHRNHYEILKILLDRGATLPVPHDVKCGCDECVSSSKADSLRHSQARINAYRALTAPSLIALSSADPLLSAFQLSWELRRLSRMETEFGAEYKALRQQCQDFATTLLDHTRTSRELEIILNYNPWELDCWETGERQTLGRLKLAIKYKQKAFVAHPNVQQLLGAIWYEGLPGFRRKNIVGQAIQVAKLGIMFPVYCTIYMLAPNSTSGKFMKKPFVKFICHSSSYMLFLSLLSLASQRAEYVALEFIGQYWMQGELKKYLQQLDRIWKEHERGAAPGVLESAVVIYIASLIWAEIRALWTDGLSEYISDLWNIVDFFTNVFYLTWISLRVASWYIVQRDNKEGIDPWYPRENWDPYDPMLLSEGAFAAGMIFSFLKLVHIFSINPYLGPLQVSLGRMILDIIKFFFVYMLVLFAFGCGLNQLMWYYADMEKNKCYHNNPNGLPDFDTQEKACSIWRRYANLFETSQSLFWASFGLVDLMTFDLTGIKSFTRFWALLTFGAYSVINIIVLLNMLIAMMSNSYQIISERADMEWKFARSNLWISYFDDGDTVPPPFNIIPTPKHIFGWMKRCCKSNNRGSIINKSREKAREQHEAVMRVLVRRYVTAEQRARDDVGVTEDDVMEIRQDISTLRYELIDILHNNGMKTPRIQLQDATVAGKKGRVMERRLLKDFQIGIVEGIINDVLSKKNEPKDVFSQIAKAIGKASMDNKKRDWNAMVRRSTIKRDPIGTTQEFTARRSRQSLRAHILDNVQAKTIDQDKLLAFNPRLSSVTPTTRVAYAKFMRSKLKSDFATRERLGRQSSRSFSSDQFNLEDEVFESPAQKKYESPTESDKPSLRPTCSASQTFRSRTPIAEASDDEAGGARNFQVEADVEDQQGECSEDGQTRPLKSWSVGASETSTAPFDNDSPQAHRSSETPKSETSSMKDHVIQIDIEDTHVRQQLGATSKGSIKKSPYKLHDPKEGVSLVSATEDIDKASAKPQLASTSDIPKKSPFKDDSNTGVHSTDDVDNRIERPFSPTSTYPQIHSARGLDSRCAEETPKSSDPSPERSDSRQSRVSRTSSHRYESRQSRLSKASITSEKSLKTPQSPKSLELARGTQKKLGERSPGFGSPGRTARVTPSPTPSFANTTGARGKSKVTGKTVSGWI